MDGTTATTRRHGKRFPSPILNEANTDDFWKFCLYHYNKPEVQQACVKLQEEFKGNVNLALLLAWLESEQYFLSLNTISALTQCIKESEPIVRRFRLLRREIKPQLTQGAYQKVLNYELQLEKFQQHDLIVCVNQHSWLTEGGSCLLRYCERLDPSGPELYPALMSRLLADISTGDDDPETPTEQPLKPVESQSSASDFATEETPPACQNSDI